MDKEEADKAAAELAASEAVPALMKLIGDPTYTKTRGTFVYALQTMNWYSRFGPFMAKLLVDQNYEVREMAVESLRQALHKLSREQKSQMLNDVLLWVGKKYHSLSQAPDEVSETLDAVVPLLTIKRTIPAVATR